MYVFLDVSKSYIFLRDGFEKKEGQINETIYTFS
jgi:hypothetical protein